MSYSLLLPSTPPTAPISPFFLFLLLLHLLTSSRSHFLSCSLRFCSIHPSRSSAVAVFDRNSISTEPPLSPTTPCFSSSATPLRSLLLSCFPPLSIRETLRTRERKPPAAFLAINYAAQLFTGISCASV